MADDARPPALLAAVACQSKYAEMALLRQRLRAPDLGSADAPAAGGGRGQRALRGRAGDQPPARRRPRRDPLQGSGLELPWAETAAGGEDPPSSLLGAGGPDGRSRVCQG